MHVQAFVLHDTSSSSARQQFGRYLMRPDHPTAAGGGRTGHGLARLITHDPRVVRSFDDHAAIARHLLAADELDVLCLVAASGLLHGQALQCYRWAIRHALDR